MEISTKVNCKYCKEENLIVRDKLNVGRFNLIGNEDTIQLMYYECSNCKKLNVIQVDNDYTLSLLKEVTNLLAKGMKLRQKGVNRTLLKNEFEKKRDLLESERLHLAKKYNGMVASNENLSLIIEVGEKYEYKRKYS